MGERIRVLVVDDKLEMAETVADGLVDRGFDAVAVDSSTEAVERLKAEHIDAVVTDLRMPELDGFGLLAASKALKPERPVLLMTAYGAVDSAITAIREGAYHYLTKPFKVDELAVFLERALEEASIRAEAHALKSELQGRYALKNVIAQSEGMKRVLELISRVAPTNAAVLLLGETGTGKGHLAHSIHGLSPRRARAFVTVNCAALPEALLESELFGHAKGAFTGATSQYPGLFVQADGGSLFLDEIGEMSPALQAKMLNVLETGRVRGVGRTDEQPVDVRIIAATHRNLRERSQQGLFREDLLYRLEVVAVEIPPLRERKEDIAALLQRYLAVAKERHEKSPVQAFSAGALARLMDYGWPGNVRELAHMTERLVLLADEAEIQAEQLPPQVTSGAAGESGAEAVRAASPARSHRLGFFGEAVSVRELHHAYAGWALKSTGGNRTHAAEVLGIDLKTLRKWLADSTETSEAAEGRSEP